MSEQIDNLRIVESPVMQSSEGLLTYSVDHADWFPDDVVTISSVALTVRDALGVTVADKTGTVTIEGLVASFTIGVLESGSYRVYGKATGDTGDIDTWYMEVYVPY